MRIESGPIEEIDPIAIRSGNGIPSNSRGICSGYCVGNGRASWPFDSGDDSCDYGMGKSGKTSKSISDLNHFLARRCAEGTIVRQDKRGWISWNAMLEGDEEAERRDSDTCLGADYPRLDSDKLDFSSHQS